MITYNQQNIIELTVSGEFCGVPGLPKPFELVDVLQFRILNFPYDCLYSGQFGNLSVRSHLLVGYTGLPSEKWSSLMYGFRADGGLRNGTQTQG